MRFIDGTRGLAPNIRRAQRLVAPCLGMLVAWAVMHAGLPALRHDWRVPISMAAEGPWLDSLTSGWLSAGIGNAQPYPTFYLVGLALRPLAWFATTTELMALVVWLGVTLAAWGASEIARARSASAATRLAVACFAALNPWVYTKLVAGHMLMVLAYGLAFALVAEIVRPAPRPFALLVLAALSITQIEFFAIAFVPLMIWTVRTRRYRVAGIVVLTAAPIAVGIAASIASIAGTPFNLEWQRDQSVAPGAAFVLDGYFTNYARAFAPYRTVGAAFALAALIGVRGALRTGIGRLAVVAAVILPLAVAGTKGPLAAPYAWLVTHVAAIGLFRELYDLLALVAIAYVVVLVEGPARGPVAGSVLAIASVVWIVPWLASPPTSFFVPAASLPSVAFPANRQVRVALLPAFQPMSFEGRGSGVDPDAYARSGRATPLNDVLPQYPVDVALARIARGDASYARALGVGTVIDRPYLQSDVASLRSQRVDPGPLGDVKAGRPIEAPLPLLGIVAAPRIVTLADDPGGDGQFFGDGDPRAVARFRFSTETIDARQAWVDARLAAELEPELSSAFGGATTLSNLPIALPRGGPWHAVLALVRGELRTMTGRLVATTSPRMRWWPLPAGDAPLVCRGACTVALAGNPPPKLLENAPLGVFRPLEIAFVEPWLATALVPSGAHGALRLAIRYDPAWACITRGRFLDHVRLATTLDGWLLPSDARPRRAIFVDVVAALQAALELVTGALLLAAGARALRRGAIARDAGLAGAEPNVSLPTLCDSTKPKNGWLHGDSPPL